MATGVWRANFDSNRLKEFFERGGAIPKGLEHLLSLPNVGVVDSEPLSEESMLLAHTLELISSVKEITAEIMSATGESGTRRLFDTIAYSAGGTLSAAHAVAKGKYANAFVITAVGDHHARRTSFGGECYLHSVAIAIKSLRREGVMNRFAIIDTDTHDGDGTVDHFATDGDVLHLCLCNGRLLTVKGAKQDYHFKVKNRMEVSKYVEYVDDACRRIKDFKPEMIFWEFGIDCYKGDYGGVELPVETSVDVASKLVAVANEVSEGRLVTVLCGGHSAKNASYIIPAVIEKMSSNA